VQVSGPADEDICLSREQRVEGEVSNACYLGLR
jgi:hypothetical protein